MIRKLGGAAFSVLFLLALPAAGQMQPGTVARIYVNKVRPGAQQQYEQGRKKHMAWHRSQNDAWAWQTWEVMTGENAGSYVVGTFNHNWKDFDGREQFEDADATDAAANMGSSEASSTLSYYALRPELSLSPGNEGTTPYVTVLHFFVKPEALNDFTQAIKKISEGIRKTNYPAVPSRWYSLANGGIGPEFALVQDRKNYAEMQPPEKTLDAMMQEAFGDEGATILKSLRSGYRSTYSELLRYRPDLSYVPKR